MGILDPIAPLQLMRIECIWLLRRLRVDRDEMRQNLIALEERIVRGGHNGSLEAAYRAIEGDVSIADGIIQKLWHCCGVDQKLPPPTGPPARKK